MKKWIYLIIPGVMLAIFVALYFSHEKEATERESVRAGKNAQIRAEEKSQKEASERKASESAKIAQQQRDADDAKKEADRRARVDAIDREIKEATDAALAESDKSIKRASQLEIELERLRKGKDLLTRETFELAKQVELAMVAKRNAELEDQRMIEMIVRRADQSAMAKMPPPPPPPPPPPKK